MSNRLFLAGTLIVSISVASFKAGVGLSVNFATAASERTYDRFEGVILHGCYDGDTCTFTIPGVHPLLGDRIGVRLRGIDTPEIRGKCEEEKALARKARDRLEGLLKGCQENQSCGRWQGQVLSHRGRRGGGWGESGGSVATGRAWREV